MLHAEAAVASFERGLHVYLEKPIAAAVEDAKRVVEAWRRAGTVGRIGFNFRFHPLVGELRAALRSGVLGELVGARTLFSAARRSLPEWKRERRSGGGAVLDLASHHFDLARFLFDQEIAEVGALLRSVETEGDTAAIELRLAAGPLVTIFVSLAAVEEDRIEVYGSRGGLSFDRYRSSRLRFASATRDFRRTARLRAAAAALASLPRALRDAALPPPEPSYALSFADFVGAVRGHASAGADLEDGLRCLEIVSAAERAASSGRTVTLGEVA
jgi:predicted dehydrogenase